MASLSRQPRLRLVGDDLTHAPPLRRREVERETRAAAANRDLDPSDPRWVLATRVRGQLQGAALNPERRDRLLRLATTLDIRPFDANLIIAIVQDEARRGERFDTLEARLALIYGGKNRSHRAAAGRRRRSSAPLMIQRIAMQLLLASLLAAALFVIALQWLFSGE